VTPYRERRLADVYTPPANTTSTDVKGLQKPQKAKATKKKTSKK
jgi:hypothetical protein